MTDIIDGIPVDLSIYENWPEAIKDFYAVYIPGNETFDHKLCIVNDKKSPAKTIRYILSEEDPEYLSEVARIFWVEYSDFFVVTKVYVNKEYRNFGVATFMSVLLRTWLAENFNKTLTANKNSIVAAEINSVIKKIENEYNVIGENWEEIREL